MAQAIRTYKVVAFFGEPDLKRKADSGILELGKDRLLFHFGLIREVLYTQMQKVEVEQDFKVGTIIRIQLAGEPLSILVPRINLGGYAVVVNQGATQELYEAIRGEWARAIRESADSSN